MDILYIVLVFIVGYFMGCFRASKHMLDRILSKPESMIELLEKYKAAKKEDSVVSDAREIEIQQENSVLYLYAKDNGEFLGQGKTLDQALEVVEQRFPEQNFVGHISADKAKQMGLLVKQDNRSA